MYGKEFEDADYMRGLMRGLSNKLFSYDDIISDKVFSNIAKSVDRTKMKVGKVTSSKAGKWYSSPYTVSYRNKVTFGDNTYVQFTLTRRNVTNANIIASTHGGFILSSVSIMRSPRQFPRILRIIDMIKNDIEVDTSKLPVPNGALIRKTDDMFYFIHWNEAGLWDLYEIGRAGIVTGKQIGRAHV